MFQCLPEILSNKACSLRPTEEKLTFSAVFIIESNKVKNQWFGKTVINSDYRFSYEEAQEVIETKDVVINKDISLTKKEYKIPDSVKIAILKLNEIAVEMRKLRMKQGAISFDKKEVRFTINKDKEPTGVYVKNLKRQTN